MKAKNIYILLISVLFIVSCNSYSKIQKSSDNDLKFTTARELYEKGKYIQAATLFESVLPAFRGTEKGEEALYLLGMSYLKNKDYYMARGYFSNYYRSYPRGKYAEDSKFYVGYCYYKDSPDVKLDQTSTIQSLEELFLFADLYPNSSRLPEVLSMVKELQDKLAYKAYLNADLYYRLGNYMGNNYLSAVIAASNAIKEFPNSKYTEELSFLILKSKFQQAEKSVEAKMEERYRDTVDEYYNFIKQYPESKLRKEAQQILTKSQQYLDKN
jgi:outer membrane protein assembly factor BamD